jgi:uncharacterized glyoxalase superfamily protein PhnB
MQSTEKCKREMIPMAYSTPRITPYLLYEDLRGALDWLAKAFGFSLRHPTPDGEITHAEMQVGDDGVIMMGYPGPQYRNPKRQGQATQNLYVRVDSLDAHFERAVKAGAIVLEKPTDQPYGDRRYGVEDPEGHRWYFAETIFRAT